MMNPYREEEQRRNQIDSTGDVIYTGDRIIDMTYPDKHEEIEVEVKVDGVEALAEIVLSDIPTPNQYTLNFYWRTPSLAQLEIGLGEDAAIVRFIEK